MDTYHISGGRRLSGTVNTAGAKNAVLPLLAASIMGSGETVLHNCPALSDVYAMLGILEAAGCRTDFNGGRVRVCPGISEEAFLHEDLVRELRSSVFLLGPMLALKRSVHMGFPGGCDIGKRPVDIHLEALRRMGAEIEEMCIRDSTSDNPRTESPFAILDDIVPGVESTGCEYIVIEDRRKAIKEAIKAYQPGDVIIIAGKGHEDYQIIGTVKQHFDDRETAQQIIEQEI